MFSLQLRTLLVSSLVGFACPSYAQSGSAPRALQDMFGGNSSSVTPTFGQALTITARYEIEPVPHGNGTQTVTLVEGSGKRWVRAYRAVPEEFQFVDRMVLASGRPYWLPPNEKQLQGPHFEPHRIRLAPREEPATVQRGLLPEPPLVDTKEAIASLSGRWASVVGRLRTFTAQPSLGSFTARLELSDGTPIRIDHISHAAKVAWRKRVGDQVTVIGRVRYGQPIRLEGNTAVCAGRIHRCGMEKLE